MQLQCIIKILVYNSLINMSVMSNCHKHHVHLEHSYEKISEEPIHFTIIKHQATLRQYDIILYTQGRQKFLVLFPSNGFITQYWKHNHFSKSEKNKFKKLQNGQKKYTKIISGNESFKMLKCDKLKSIKYFKNKYNLLLSRMKFMENTPAIKQKIMNTCQ